MAPVVKLQNLRLLVKCLQLPECVRNFTIYPQYDLHTCIRLIISFFLLQCYIFNYCFNSTSKSFIFTLFQKFTPPPEVLEYCRNGERYYSEFSIQQDDKLEILCGHYCVYMLYKLSNGFKFNEVLKELQSYGNLDNIWKKK